MLSVLLTAASAVNTPHTLCPPCHPEDAHTPHTVVGFVLSLVKSALSFLVIAYPLYKTFKAWESNRLRACRAMLAYWSAMTLLNTLKEATDEIVGEYVNTALHHVIVAAIKLAPLVLGPDKIYDLTVRSFFESHEEQLDVFIQGAHDHMVEYKKEIIEKAVPMIENAKETVTPMIENVKETLSPMIDNIREAASPLIKEAQAKLGIGAKDELELEKERAREAMRELTPVEAVVKDAELAPTLDPTAATGLKQRRKILAQASPINSAASVTRTPVSSSTVSEIERARADAVLVEKIIWGHGLSAKHEEFQRQQKQKAEIEQTIDVTMSRGESAFSIATLPSPSSVPPLPPLPADDKQRLVHINNDSTKALKAAAPLATGATKTGPTTTSSSVIVDDNGYSMENRKEL